MHRYPLFLLLANAISLLHEDMLIRPGLTSGLRPLSEILLLFRLRLRHQTPKNDVWRCFFEPSCPSETVSILLFFFFFVAGCIYIFSLHIHI